MTNLSELVFRAGNFHGFRISHTRHLFHAHYGPGILTYYIFASSHLPRSMWGQYDYKTRFPYE